MPVRRVDPEGAARLHPNNLKRVIRALEVYEQTGMTLDAFNRLHKRPAPKYQAIKIGVCPAERQVLYERIDKRVDQMLADGLLDETPTPAGARRARRYGGAGDRLQGAAGFSAGRTAAGGMRCAAQAAQPQLCKKTADLAEKG